MISREFPLTFLILALTVLGNAQEKSLEAAKAEFTKADQGLNQIYTEAQSTLPEWTFGDLQQDQREWLEYRDLRAEQAAAFDGGAAEGQEKNTPDYWETLAALTQERTLIIGGWIRHDRFAHEWEGVWIDGQGGHLSILQNEAGHFTFRLEVVRGPTYHLGQIGGTAKWNGATAHFETRAEDDEGETWLTFLKRDLRLEIIGENTSSFHGARAYFEGHYVRVSELTEEDRKAILTPEE